MPSEKPPAKHLGTREATSKTVAEWRSGLTVLDAARFPAG